MRKDGRKEGRKEGRREKRKEMKGRMNGRIFFLLTDIAKLYINLLMIANIFLFFKPLAIFYAPVIFIPVVFYLYFRLVHSSCILCFNSTL